MIAPSVGRLVENERGRVDEVLTRVVRVHDAASGGVDVGVVRWSRQGVGVGAPVQIDRHQHQRRWLVLQETRSVSFGVKVRVRVTARARARAGGLGLRLVGWLCDLVPFEVRLDGGEGAHKGRLVRG